MTGAPTYADQLAEARDHVASLCAEAAQAERLPASRSASRRHRVLCILRDWWQQELVRLRQVS